MKPYYNRKQLAEAFRKTGIRKGSVVFTHSNVGYFGFPEEGRESGTVLETIFGAFQDVITEEGTLVVPTFTLSFCKGLTFDPKNSGSFCGIFSEMLRQYPGAYRSDNPLFSVAAFGGKGKQLIEDLSEECFGKDSFWDRFLQVDGVVCNLNLDAGSTFIHYVEKCLEVPYRYDKLFTGTTVKNGIETKTGAVFFCQDMSNPGTVAAFEPFDDLAKKKGLVRSASVGRGGITVITASDTVDIIKKEIKKNPGLLTMAGKEGKRVVLSREFDISERVSSLDKHSSMATIIEKLWKLPREVLSDGYDKAIFSLKNVMDMKIHAYPTGEHCWTWIVPEKWTCEEAYLETLEGERILDQKDNPLHCVSYSLPFSGKVTKEELFAHLYTHPFLSDAIPYIYKPYERVWGLTCSKDTKDSLTDEEYKVEIKTKFSQGALKVGEIVVPGKTKDTFVICAHLCHTYMTNDDLAGVAVALDVMRKLKAMEERHYTYRLLIVPETIGSVAWLSHNEELISSIKGGLFIEMVGRNAPHSLQLSFNGDTQMDKVMVDTLKSFDPEGWVGPFRGVIQNDEKQFNAPGVRIPMLSLSRVDSPGSATWPYPEYHSDKDDMSNIFPERLEATRDLVLEMLKNIENGLNTEDDLIAKNDLNVEGDLSVEGDLYVVNKFKGEVFCSRHGIHIDFYSNPEGNKKLFDIIYLIDGTRTVADIASECSLSMKECRDVLARFEDKGLIYFSNIPIGK